MLIVVVTISLIVHGRATARIQKQKMARPFVARSSTLNKVLIIIAAVVVGLWRYSNIRHDSTVKGGGDDVVEDIDVQPTIQPTHQPTTDFYMPPDIIIPFREITLPRLKQEYKSVMLLRATVSCAIKSFPQSKIVLLLYQKFHDETSFGGNELIENLLNDFPNKIELGYMKEQASERTNFYVRQCNRANMNHEKGSLCASSMLRKLMDVLDYVSSSEDQMDKAADATNSGHSVETTGRFSNRPFLVLNIGTLLFLTTDSQNKHVRSIYHQLLHFPQLPLFTSLEGLGNGCGLKQDVHYHRYIGKHVSDHHFTHHHHHQHHINGLYMNDMLYSKNMDQLESERKWMVTHTSAPLFFTTKVGLAALIGTSIRALVADLKIPSPSSADW
jgi:hypothetical protein